jgi:hypothetical protein
VQIKNHIALIEKGKMGAKFINLNIAEEQF